MTSTFLPGDLVYCVSDYPCLKSVHVPVRGCVYTVRRVILPPAIISAGITVEELPDQYVEVEGRRIQLTFLASKFRRARSHLEGIALLRLAAGGLITAFERDPQP